MRTTLFFLLVIAALSVSCSSDNSTKEPFIDGTTLFPKKIHLTQQGSFPGFLLYRDFTFVYDGNKIISTAGDGQIIASYIYNNDRLTRINLSGQYDGSKYVLLDYDAEGRFIAYTKFDPVTATAEKHILAYSDEHIDEQIYKGNMTNQSTFDGIIYRRVQNGNIMSRQYYDPYQSYSYSYDTKRDPFSNISNFEVFKLLNTMSYPCGSSNNNVIVSTRSGERTTYSNTYNTAGFLTSFQQRDAFNSPVLKAVITY